MRETHQDGVNSRVAELEQADILTPNKARYFEGMLAPADARKHKFPASADERGLLITSTLSDPTGSVHAAIRRDREAQAGAGVDLQRTYAARVPVTARYRNLQFHTCVLRHSALWYTQPVRRLAGGVEWW